MECRIYDNNLNAVGQISNFVSLLWSEGYNTTGNCQFVCYKNEHSLNLLKRGFFLSVPDSDTLMYMTTIQDRSNRLWVYGSECKCILGDRVYQGTIECRGRVENSLRNALINSRPYDIIGLAQSRGLDATITSQYTCPTIEELSEKWCDRAGYGYRLVHDKQNKKLLYDIYNGVYRTYLKFSTEYGNIYDLKLTDSEVDFKNVAYVAGEGHGSERIVVTVDNSGGDNFERREMFVDARDIQREEEQSEEDYKNLLISRGIEKLNERLRVYDVNFELATEKFNKDFFLGDTIICVLNEYNTISAVRVVGFEIAYEQNKKTTRLKLGTPLRL